ncbi:hypothetical protein D0X99_19665 [Algoriphagus lacus]|uniref:Lantibiotic dehydratase N-terminal domain-containing protein n=1 Tax=Algoriphagus lacus TaxID=2056311 RepID=A0A418PLF8_9BACT|nr:thiopeptide-type bacteriocin biosynthesis protein [Algoriphagus lacus]RIW12176.1 hypothetical protein D0X99_19665 [Algoriphagus lacus]
MDFLYRMHLVDFDPRDTNQILTNWDWIKQALKLSSDSLYQEIENRDFDTLSPFTKAKLYKYLLRGRYRSTPFGLWAGVGLGNWGSANQIELPIAYREIIGNISNDAGKQTQEPSKYRSAPGLKAYADQIQYWSYCRQEEGWRISYLDKNPLVAILLTYFEKSETLDFRIFQTFFKTKKENKILEIWEMLIESGFLIPDNLPEVATSPLEMGLDIKLTSKITINRVIQEKLKNLISEIGHLFVPVESEFLNNFKAWFRYTFDDRFVPLSLLAHQNDFSIHSEPEMETMKKDLSHSPEILGELWRNAEEFDLSRCFDKKKTELHHLQIAFKIFGDNELFIENIVCNRPFAYSGRFSLDSEIKNLVSSKIEDISQEAVFADLILFESQKSNHISRHDNVFDFSIFPFGCGTPKNHLGTDDLHLGFRQERLILISQKLNKQVVPVVQHPLNPNQISHPLSRVIWEIGNQDQYRFLPYQDPTFQSSSYVPRLTWNGIILQEKRWILNSKSHSSQKDLHQFLQKSNIPSSILAGHLDRELVLDWTDPTELGFLWEELQRLKEVTIYECPWKEHSPFQKQDGQQLYPQVIYSWKGKSRTAAAIQFQNRIIGSDPCWTYARIGIKEEGLMPFLFKPFPRIILGLKEKYLLKKWYFLFYNSPKSEIRLRLLPRDQHLNPQLASDLRKGLMECGWIESVQFDPYYPEFEKYDLPDRGIETSESIFHQESELMILGDENRDYTSILTWEERDRRSWITQTYHRLIELSGRQDLFFHYYQGLVKQIPALERRELNKAGIFQSEIVKDCYGAEIFNSEFSKIASGSEEVLLRLIPNHIHMCCNRAFPTETQEHERRVIYGLYKKLGKSLHGRLTNL